MQKPQEKKNSLSLSSPTCEQFYIYYAYYTLMCFKIKVELHALFGKGGEIKKSFSLNYIGNTHEGILKN